MEILNKNGKVIPQLITKGDEKKPWDQAHNYLDGEVKSTGDAEYVEPNLKNELFSAKDPGSSLNQPVSEMDLIKIKNFQKPFSGIPMILTFT